MSYLVDLPTDFLEGVHPTNLSRGRTRDVRIDGLDGFYCWRLKVRDRVAVVFGRTLPTHVHGRHLTSVRTADRQGTLHVRQ